MQKPRNRLHKVEKEVVKSMAQQTKLPEQAKKILEDRRDEIEQFFRDNSMSVSPRDPVQAFVEYAEQLLYVSGRLKNNRDYKNGAKVCDAEGGVKQETWDNIIKNITEMTDDAFNWIEDYARGLGGEENISQLSKLVCRYKTE